MRTEVRGCGVSHPNEGATLQDSAHTQPFEANTELYDFIFIYVFIFVFFQ